MVHLREGTMDKLARGDRPPSSVGKAVFGSVLVLIGAVFGFAVSEWRSRIRDAELAGNVRRSIALEVADNLKTMEAQARRHYAALEKLHRARPIPDHTAFQTLFENLHGDLGAPMKRAAWDAAVSSGSLRLLDNSLVERYSEIY